jgi:hypothetical protein
VAVSSQLTDGPSGKVQHLFARSGGYVWETVWGGGAAYSKYNASGNLGPSIGTPVAGAISSQLISGQNHIYTLSSDGNLWYLAWGNGANTRWTAATGLGGSASGLSSQILNGPSGP